jgi:hypothetical protein
MCRRRRILVWRVVSLALLLLARDRNNVLMPALSELPIMSVVQPAYHCRPNGGHGNLWPSANRRLSWVLVLATMWFVRWRSEVRDWRFDMYIRQGMLLLYDRISIVHTEEEFAAYRFPLRLLLRRRGWSAQQSTI